MVHDQTNEQAAKTEDPMFLPVGSGRAFDSISEQIRAKMAEGKLQPGSRMPPERLLAAQFGVSRNTLREALRSLENSGVLVLKRGAQSGAYIKQSDGEGITTGLIDMFNLGTLKPVHLTAARILIESAIVRAACASILPQDIEAMEKNVEEAMRHSKEGRVEERIRANLDFHRILAQATHNPLLVAVMNAILNVLQMFINTLGPYGDDNYVFRSRRKFLRHVKKGEVDAAVQEMEKSLMRLQRQYLSRAEDGAEGIARK
jgi:DNA-binding FadR family transcriptional regulator